MGSNMEDDIAKTIGTRIKSKREEMGISQKDLADMIGVTPAAVSQFEKGVKKPSSSVLATISRQLGVSTDYLFGAADRKELFLSGDIAAAFRDFEKLDNEDRETILDHIKYLKSKSKRKKNP